MTDFSEAERYLVQQIRRGDSEAWRQLVERYQGRLLAFARSRSTHRSDAEDLVQETFLQFLRGLGGFREEASLETYLFMILRRRIVDGLRGKKFTACLSTGSDREDDDTPGSSLHLPSPDLSASTYARRDETASIEKMALADALTELLDALKQEENFRDLKVVEMIFYGQMRNKEIARLVELEENHVALIKHRWLKALKERVQGRLTEARGAGHLADLETSAADSLLTEIWEDRRPSCPKRSTVGRFLLHTLDSDWQEYVEFHINRLGCRFCRANLDDLQTETRVEPQVLREKVMQSTVGFFKK